jgi:iduronate 2-sulfatase
MGGNTFVIVAADGDDMVHSDGKTAAKACELIEKHSHRSRFSSPSGFVRPHVPFVSPKKYFDLYPWEQMTLPEKVARRLG